MFSKKIIMAFALAVISIALVCTAYAQWIPASTEVNLGDFTLTGSVSQAGTGVYQIGGEPVNSLSVKNQTVNNSSINNTTVTSTQPTVLDLTQYAQDRLKGNLTGYTNIMYPFGESRGTTASTSSSSGCGCGG